MLASLSGIAFTLAALTLIGLVFAVALVHLSRELGWVKALTDQLGYALATETDRPAPDLVNTAILDEMHTARSNEPAAAQKILRGWEMRVHRLEPALGFWVDLLRQLGLLFTVVGLGLAFAVERGSADLLGPLSLAVWTTVAGLALSIWLSAQFGTRIPVWSDACEKNIAAWSHGKGVAAR
jgi:hypothetical protein